MAEANPLDVEDYLDCFEELSVTLLEYVVNMTDVSVSPFLVIIFFIVGLNCLSLKPFYLYYYYFTDIFLPGAGFFKMIYL